MQEIFTNAIIVDINGKKERTINPLSLYTVTISSKPLLYTSR